jgi:hypothetical protein
VEPARRKKERKTQNCTAKHWEDGSRTSKKEGKKALCLSEG